MRGYAKKLHTIRRKIAAAEARGDMPSRKLKARLAYWERIATFTTRGTKRPAKSFYQTPEWKRLRYDALKKYGARCQCCGKSPQEHRISLNVDHIEPISKRWDLRLEISNLQVLCSDCNWGKGGRDNTDWRPKDRSDPSEEELQRIRAMFDMDAPDRI